MRARCLFGCSALLLGTVFAPVAHSGEGEPADRAGLLRVEAGPSPIYAYVPDRWGSLQVNLSNPTEEPVELVCMSYVEGTPSLQYGRRVWLPAHSRVNTSHLIRTPPQQSYDQKFVELRTFVLDPQQAAETLVSQASGELQAPASLRYATRTIVTMLVAENDIEKIQRDRRIRPVDLVLTARFERNIGENMLHWMDETGPSSSEALDAVDQIIIAEDRLQHDAAALTAIRRWLYNGGRLWVLLDRVDAPFLQALLADAWDCEVVDRVGLTHVEMESATTGQVVSTADFEQPVEFVRLLAPTAEAAYRVNGWPAVLWKTCGQGQLLVTTIGGEALVRPRTSSDQRPPGGMRLTPFVQEPALEALSNQFFNRKSSLLPAQTTANAIVSEEIGYSIPSWSLIVGLLSAFVIGLLGYGVWCLRGGRAVSFAVGATCYSALVGGALLFAGHSTLRAVPATTALWQIVQPIPGTNDVEISGTAGVFVPDAADAALEGQYSGWIRPPQDAAQGVVKRLVWSDLDKWRWEHVPQSPGLQLLDYHESLVTESPVSVSTTLNVRGLTGQMLLPKAIRPTDGAIVTETGRIGVDFHADGSFTAAADRVMTPDQFLAASIVSDEQQRRGRFLATWLTSKEARGFPSQPTLMFWTEPWQTGLTCAEPSVHTGSALVVLPITISRPEAGTELTIPAPMLPYRETSGGSVQVAAGWFDYRTLQWVERHNPVVSRLQFQAPSSLLPLEPVSARLTVQVTGPIGKLTAAVANGNETLPAHTWVDPVGTLTWDITLADGLTLSPDGKLVLELHGGDPDRPELTLHRDQDNSHVTFWHIESLNLELRARVPGN